MKVNEIVLGRKFNLGNYESAECRISVSPEPEEQAQDWEKTVDGIFSKLNQKLLVQGLQIKGQTSEK